MTITGRDNVQRLDSTITGRDNVQTLDSRIIVCYRQTGKLGEKEISFF